jgi:hypothetical protein
MTNQNATEWVIQVFDTGDDELIAERSFGGVDQRGLTALLGFMPTAFATIPLNREMLERLGATDLVTGDNQEAFLELHDNRTRDEREAAADWRSYVGRPSAVS